ncbi:sterol desaturase family protein [Thalassospira sp. MCCC 1A01428]|uniref:sterol desaturase family protein n=1 Tax=Thalassospira sp. MCCC 1A01428 TaxID=1470575 RepID=UPI000A1DC709|nr:sterol desaturase family protein [Thalassospira sp. MCCC 1A01428]
MDQTVLFRLAVFAVLLLIMAGWEFLLPYRTGAGQSRGRRWLTNFSLMICGAALSRFTIGAAMIIAASYAQGRGWGLLPMLGLPAPVAVVLAVIGLDCAVYWQHRFTHMFDVLWRFHRVHHVDPGFDVSTAVRFHPLEIAVSAAYKAAFVVVLGADAWAVVIYETLLSSFALFNHGNVHLPRLIDQTLRGLFVTPDMHRIHHSAVMVETNSNYGNILSLWDRIFASYTDKSRENDREMTIGLNEFRDRESQSLVGSLWLPFRSKPRHPASPAATAGDIGDKQQRKDR